MYVKVQNISTNGSIGPNVKIEARNVTISGQTHATSSIKCVQAELGIHKGIIKARTVNVKTLQGGEIIADNVVIEQALSGKVTAKNIKINILGSYVVLEASQDIEVKRTIGEENKFIFTTAANSGLDNTKEDEHDYLKTLKNELNLLIEKFKLIKTKVKNNLEPCRKIKETIIKSKNLGKKIPSTLIDKFKLCKIMNVHYKKLREDIEFKKNQHNELNAKLSSSVLEITNSKLKLGTPLNGFNHIQYILNKPERKIELNIDNSMNKRIFQLDEDENGVLKVINSDL